MNNKLAKIKSIVDKAWYKNAEVTTMANELAGANNEVQSLARTLLWNSNFSQCPRAVCGMSQITSMLKGIDSGWSLSNILGY